MSLHQDNILTQFMLFQKKFISNAKQNMKKE